MANLSTLKPFKSGSDSRRNTKGRPVGSYSVKGMLQKILNEKTPEGITKAELLIRRLVQKALTGKSNESLTAIAKIINMVDGPVPKYKEGVSRIEITPEAKKLADDAINEYLNK